MVVAILSQVGRGSHRRGGALQKSVPSPCCPKQVPTLCWNCQTVCNQASPATACSSCHVATVSKLGWNRNGSFRGSRKIDSAFQGPAKCLGDKSISGAVGWLALRQHSSWPTCSTWSSATSRSFKRPTPCTAERVIRPS